MRARDLIGRRIVRLRQARFMNRNTGQQEIELCWLELDNGALVSFTAGECHAGPFVSAVVRRPKREG